jgi:hypothetical protein
MNENRKRHRHQRDPEIAGRTADPVDQLREQRRQNAGQDAAGGNREKTVGGLPRGSDRLGQSSTSIHGSGNRMFASGNGNKYLSSHGPDWFAARRF